MTDTGIKGTVVLVDGTEVEFSIDADGTFMQWGAPTEKLGSTVALMERLAEAFLVEYVDGRTCSECGVVVDGDPGEDHDLLCEDCGNVTVISRVPRGSLTTDNLPMGGCSNWRIHDEHLAAGEPRCENQRDT